MTKIRFISAAIITTVLLSSCASGENAKPCPPKSDTQVVADTISDILVPKIRWGC